MNWRCDESGSREDNAYTGYHATIDHEGGLDAGDVSASDSEHSAVAVVSAAAVLVDSVPLSDAVFSVDSAPFVPVDSPPLVEAISDESVSVYMMGNFRCGSRRTTGPFLPLCVPSTA